LLETAQRLDRLRRVALAGVDLGPGDSSIGQGPVG
jgi:hypothetical protein